MSRIFILGAGWLGAPLATQLNIDGYSVWASYRNNKPEVDKQIRLVDSHNILETLNHCFPEVLIIALTPSQDTLKLIKQIEGLSLNSLKQVIYTSSTSVYPKKPGTYDTHSVIVEESIVVQTEQVLKKIFAEKLTILRLGGLFGSMRHPIKFLSGKNTNTNPNDPIILIHRSDVISVIKFLVTNEIRHKVYNLFYPLSASKREYYRHIARSLNYSEPIWDSIDNEQRIIVLSALFTTQKQLLANNPLEFKFEYQ